MGVLFYIIFVAMPRLMMCAQATLQALALLPLAPVMKQFQQGQGWMVACSKGGQYHEENLGEKKQATSCQPGLDLLPRFMQTL